MSTFLQLYSRVLDYTHRPKNQDTTEAKALVNDAYFHVVSQLKCNPVISAPVTLTAADGDYSITTDLGVTDFSSLRSLTFTAANGSTTLSTLAPSSVDEVRALRGWNPSATSPSTTYAIDGWDTLMLQPLPALGDTLTLVYDAIPAAMVADSDTPTELPIIWHHLIVQRAAATAFEVVDDQRAIAHQRQYEHELGEARKWFATHVSTRGYAPTVGISRPVMWPGDDWHD